MKLTINLIGAGNVAWHLSNAFANTDYTIKQVYSRTLNKAQQLANTFGYEAVKKPADFDEAEAIILAVDDNQIETVANELPNPFNAVVIHTSGSVSIDALQIHQHRAVFWMIESLTTGKKMNYSQIPIIVHYSDTKANNLVNELARTISSKVHILADTERRKLHLAAVMANNFTNHLFGLMKEYTHQNDLDFNLLKPIIDSTIESAIEGDPLQLQTGPAVRRDHKTLQAHLDLLTHNKPMITIYEALSNSIQQTHKNL